MTDPDPDREPHAVVVRNGRGVAHRDAARIIDDRRGLRRCLPEHVQRPSGLPATERMARSFHIQSDQERAAAPSPTVVAARSAEAVAGTLADGFARRDPDLLGT